MTLIDRDYLKEMMPDLVMKKITSLASVKSVSSKKHLSVNYATIDFYFPGTEQRTRAIN